MFDLSMVTTIKPSAWLCLLIILLLFSFLHKSFFQGFDLIWPLFGISCELNHSRQVVGLYFIWITLINLGYSSNLSSDSLKLKALPDLVELVEIGYKLLDDGGSFAGIASNETVETIKYTSSKTRKKFVGKYAMTDLWFQGNFRPNDVKDLIAQSVKLKLIMASGMYDYCPGVPSYILEEVFCTKFDVSDQVGVLPFPSFRYWGIFASRFHKYYQSWVQASFHMFWRHLKNNPGKKSEQRFILSSPIGGFAKFRRLDLQSAVGVCLKIFVSIGVFLFGAEVTRRIDVIFRYVCTCLRKVFNIASDIIKTYLRAL